MTNPNPPGQPPHGQPPHGNPPGNQVNYQNPPPNRGTNPLAITGFIVALASILACCLHPAVGIVVAAVGAVLSGLGEKQIREGKGGGMGLAKAGRVIGIILSIIWTVLLILFIAGVAWVQSPAGQDWFRDQGFEVTEEGEVIEREPEALPE